MSVHGTHKYSISTAYTPTQNTDTQRTQIDKGKAEDGATFAEHEKQLKELQAKSKTIAANEKELKELQEKLQVSWSCGRPCIFSVCLCGTLFSPSGHDRS